MRWNASRKEDSSHKKLATILKSYALFEQKQQCLWTYFALCVKIRGRSHTLKHTVGGVCNPGRGSH